MRADDSIANIIRSNSNCMRLPISYLCKHKYISIFTLLLQSKYETVVQVYTYSTAAHARQRTPCIWKTMQLFQVQPNANDCVRANEIYANFEFECLVSVSMCRGHAFHVANCRWNEIKKAVSNIICGSRCAMRTDLHALFLVRIHHWTAQQKKSFYLLLMIRRPDIDMTMLKPKTCT